MTDHYEKSLEAPVATPVGVAPVLEEGMIRYLNGFALYEYPHFVHRFDH